MAGRLERGLQAIAMAFLLFALIPAAKMLADAEPFAIGLPLFLRTFLQAGASSILAIALALPLAWAMCEKSALTRIVRPLTLFPAIMPPLVMILVATQLLGYSGIFPAPSLLYSFWGMVIVHALYNFPLAARLISGAMPPLQGYSDIARTMSAGRIARMLKVWLPMLKPAVLGVFWVVFAYCFTSFSIPLIFGGGSNSTVETEIYSSFYSQLDFGKAAFLAVAQIIVLLPLILQLPHDSGLFRKPVFSKGSSMLRKALLAIYLLAIGSMLAAPFLKMGAVSIQPAPIINSFAIAIMAATLSLLVFAALPPFMRRASYLLLAISPATLALAYSGFAGSWAAVVLAHSLIALPLFQLALGSRIEMALKQAEIAAVLGADFPNRIFRVVIPSLRRELAIAWMLGLFVSLSDIVLVQAISSGSFQTISTVMMSSFSHYRFSEGVFYSFLLICISIAAMFLADWLNGD